MTKTPTLVSLNLTLKATEKAMKSERPIPRWWGRAAHALFLNILQEADSTLSKQLHDQPSGVMPFTTSTLIGAFPKGKLKPDYDYTLRLTALGDNAPAMALDAIQKGGNLATGAEVELDHLHFRVIGTDPSAGQAQTRSPWAGVTTFQELSSPYLLHKEKIPRKIKLLFTSPTTFKSGNMHVPLPTPELIFNSLLDQWNAFAPIEFPEEVRRYANECLAVSRYQLSSSAVKFKNRGLRIGGVGKMTLTTIHYDPYWMGIIQTLASFSLYAGVGVGTTMGLGQCRKR